MRRPEKRKAANAGERAAFQIASDRCILTDLVESIKAVFLAGRDVRLIDYTPEQRPLVIGAIAQLRDELPIRTGWQTVRESHLSETRLRARRYSIPGEFLRESGDA
jgi:hypothetical protein